MMSVMASGVEKRRSDCSLPVAIGGAFTPPPQSGLAWLCFLLPGRPGDFALISANLRRFAPSFSSFSAAPRNLVAGAELLINGETPCPDPDAH